MASLLVLLMCGYITALPFKLFKHRIKRIKQICLTERYIKQKVPQAAANLTNIKIAELY
jgi:hypothetical protein